MKGGKEGGCKKKNYSGMIRCPCRMSPCRRSLARTAEAEGKGGGENVAGCGGILGVAGGGGTVKGRDEALAKGLPVV